MTSVWSWVHACVVVVLTREMAAICCMAAYIWGKLYCLATFCLPRSCNSTQWQILLLCMVCVPWQNIKSAMLSLTPWWWIVYLHRWLYAFCTHGYNSNKSFPFVFLTLPGMVIIQSHTFMDIFEPRTFLIFHSNIHSLSENESSAEGVYLVFVALQENPSLQKLEWVQPFLSFLLVNIFLLNFICCCILAWMMA